MKLRLNRIPLDQVHPGMQLAETVFNNKGQVLLQAGYELSDTALSGLRKHGIEYVGVLLRDPRNEDELESERIKTRERLNLLFRNTDNDPYLASLHSLVLEYRLEKLL